VQSSAFGDGINDLGRHIDKPVAGGVLRKEPGSTEWHFVKALTDADLDEQDRRRQDAYLREHADNRVRVVFDVPSADMRSMLAAEGILASAAPCTVVAEVTLSQLYGLAAAGVEAWQLGATRANKRVQPRMRPTRNLDSVNAPLQLTPGATFVPHSARGQIPEVQTAIDLFFEDFETNTVPGAIWATGDLNSGSGIDTWGDVGLPFTYQHTSGGEWSAWCAGNNQGVSFFSYDNNQSTYLTTTSDFNMTGYEQYDATYWVNYSTFPGVDVFTAYYRIPSGWIPTPIDSLSGVNGTWLQRGFPIVQNEAHGADFVRYMFRFASDASIVSGTGVYIDDILVRGTPRQPNLTWYTPSGWSSSIVPSSIQFTTSTGTLYSGLPTYIDWATLNNGSADVTTPFLIRYYIDGAQIGERTVSSLVQGGSANEFDWPYTVASSGQHTLKISIDPLNSVAESDESAIDNTREATFTWVVPPPPDLVVTSVVPSNTNPLVGSFIDAQVTVRNQGSGPASGAFSTYFYQNLGSPPSLNQAGFNGSNTTFTLLPGASQTFTVFNLTSNQAGTWNMYAYVDAQNNLTEAIENNNVSSAATVIWTPGAVVISGTLAYDDTSYAFSATRVNNRPVRCVKVELREADGAQTSSDQIMAVATTNASGQFTFPAIENRDTNADQGQLDLYVRASFQADSACVGNRAIRVVNASLTTWAYASGTVSNVSNGAVSLGTIKPLDYGRRSALHIYDTVLRGYTWAKARGGTPLHAWPVTVRWEPGLAAGPFYQPADTLITIPGLPRTQFGDLRPDEWDDDVLLHEYGHHLAHLFASDYPGLNARHTPSREDSCFGDANGSGPFQSACGALAWKEGLAHFLSCAMKPTPASLRENWAVNTNWSTTDFLNMDLENGATSLNSLALPGSPYNDQGWTWEVPIAGTLWDIFDSPVDSHHGAGCVDSLADGIGRTWDVLTNHPANTMYTIDDFYTLFCSRYFPGNVSLARIMGKLFCEHGMQAAGSCGIVSAESGAVGPQWIRASPNPVLGTTRIKFAVAGGEAPAEVAVAVYDVSGRRVRSLLRDRVAPGEGAIVWDRTTDSGERARAGVYFLRLSVGVSGASSTVVLLQ